MQPTRPMSWYQGSQRDARGRSSSTSVPTPCACKIVEQRAMGDRYAVREARRAARILQIGDFVRVGGRQGRRCRLDARPGCPSRAPSMPALSAAVAGEIGQFGGIEEQLRIAAGQHAPPTARHRLRARRSWSATAAAPATGRRRPRRRNRRRIRDRSRRSSASRSPVFEAERDEAARMASASSRSSA